MHILNSYVCKRETQRKIPFIILLYMYCIGASMHAIFNVDWQMSWTKYLLRASANEFEKCQSHKANPIAFKTNMYHPGP